MKYYLVVGEASGDLHASHLMTALREADGDAQFRFIGGDKMVETAGEPQGTNGGLMRHYRDLAYMGIVPVLTHLGTILKAMKEVRRDVMEWNPDALILIDYPGFNLQLAEYIHSHTSIPTIYYISPKIWARKFDNRIKSIQKNVDLLLSILPFEVDFFENKHHYHINYVGNPTMDEVSAFLEKGDSTDDLPTDKPIIALLAGSRKQEIMDNLPMMLEAVEPYKTDYHIVLAAAPGIDDGFYSEVISDASCAPEIVRDATYPLLHRATAALVTSGTATLETALFRVPQVVCYKIPKFYGLCRPLVLKVPYISLVNLIANKEVVPELLEDMSAETIRTHLRAILPGGAARQAQLEGYDLVAEKLGAPGAPRRAAAAILGFKF